jgi:hypothetical protein
MGSEDGYLSDCEYISHQSMPLDRRIASLALWDRLPEVLRGRVASVSTANKHSPQNPALKVRGKQPVDVLSFGSTSLLQGGRIKSSTLFDPKL